MAVDRVEWQCPECQRRYAIPADLPRPTICPKCQSATEQPVAVTKPVDAVAVESDRVPDSTAPTRSGDATVAPPEAEVEFRADRFRRKYPSLRVVSLFYRGMAVLIVLATVVAFVAGVVSIFQAEDQSERWSAAMIGFGSLVGGAFWSVTLLAFAELIQLLLDIEQNTRRN